MKIYQFWGGKINVPTAILIHPAPNPTFPGKLFCTEIHITFCVSKKLWFSLDWGLKQSTISATRCSTTGRQKEENLLYFCPKPLPNKRKNWVYKWPISPIACIPKQVKEYQREAWTPGITQNVTIRTWYRPKWTFCSTGKCLQVQSIRGSKMLTAYSTHIFQFSVLVQNIVITTQFNYSVLYLIICWPISFFSPSKLLITYLLFFNWNYAVILP